MNQEHILIAGGTGMVGTELVKRLLKNHKVTVLTRDNSERKTELSGVSYKEWRPSLDKDNGLILEDETVIINLAGANIFHKAWTEKYKQDILESRVSSTRALVNAINEQDHKIHTFISTSAIGYYGDDSSNSEIFTENDEAIKTDFLTNVCKIWEAEAQKVNQKVRLIVNRFGLVQSIHGGSFKESLKPLRFRVCASLGNGEQIFSWIHIFDLCEAIATEIVDSNYKGIYNLVATNPVTNNVYSESIAKAMYGDSYISSSVPEFVLKMMLGERANEVLKSNYVSSEKLSNTGFHFRYPDIDIAVKALIKEYNSGK